jgi:hypothetical protein
MRARNVSLSTDFAAACAETVACVCVCVCERERERELVSVSVCLHMSRAYVTRKALREEGDGYLY